MARSFSNGVIIFLPLPPQQAPKKIAPQNGWLHLKITTPQTEKVKMIAP